MGFFVPDNVPLGYVRDDGDVIGAALRITRRMKGLPATREEALELEVEKWRQEALAWRLNSHNLQASQVTSGQLLRKVFKFDVTRLPDDEYYQTMSDGLRALYANDPETALFGAVRDPEFVRELVDNNDGHLRELKKRGLFPFPTKK